MSTTTTSAADAPAVGSSRHALSDNAAAAIAGVVASGAALATSEVLGALVPGGTSLISSVGQVVVDLQPPGAKDFVVSIFGTNDKLALEVLIVIVSLAIGAGLGILARRSFALAALGFVAFGVVGFIAALGDPVAIGESSAVVAVVSVAVAIEPPHPSPTARGPYHGAIDFDGIGGGHAGRPARWAGEGVPLPRWTTVGIRLLLTSPP